MFFAWGFITALIDPLVATAKAIFTLSDLEAQLGASSILIAYRVMSIPAAARPFRCTTIVTLMLAPLLIALGCRAAAGQAEVWIVTGWLRAFVPR